MYARARMQVSTRAWRSTRSSPNPRRTPTQKGERSHIRAEQVRAHRRPNASSVLNAGGLPSRRVEGNRGATRL